MYTRNNFFVVQFYKEQISKQNDFSFKYLLMENLLEIQFIDAKFGWKGEKSDILIRVSFQGDALILNLSDTKVFKFKNFSSDLQLHFLVQSKNIALASFNTTLGYLFYENSKKFTKCFYLNVSENNIKFID